MNRDSMALCFKALADPNRLAVLERLAAGESCGCTLIEGAGISQPTISYHLNLLREAGLTTARKEGVWKKHFVDYGTIDQLIAYLTSLREEKGSCRNHGCGV